MTRLRPRRFNFPVLLEYISKTFTVRFIIILAGIALIMQTLDVLSESADILAADGATTGSLLRYTILRFPFIVSQVVSFAALLAALLTLASLAQHSEIVVMQSTGLSSFRIVFPMTGVCVLIALVHFVFNEAIVVQTNDEFERWRATGFSMITDQLPPAPSDAWAVEEDRRIRVRAVRREGTILDLVSIYHLGDDGKLVETIEADFAVYLDNRWTLFDVDTFNALTGERRNDARLDWQTNIPPQRFEALSVNPETVSIGELGRTVRQLQGEGLAISRLRAWFHHKVTGPMGTILMPLLAAIAGFGVFRSGALFLRVVLGTAFGFSYFIVDNLLLAVGQFGTIPPALAAWSPLILYVFLGSTVLFYTEE